MIDQNYLTTRTGIRATPRDVPGSWKKEKEKAPNHEVSGGGGMKNTKNYETLFRGRLVIREVSLFREGVGAGSLTTRKATDDSITVASKSVNLQNTG
jgi:hypothetical protein